MEPCEQILLGIFFLLMQTDGNLSDSAFPKQRTKVLTPLLSICFPWFILMNQRNKVYGNETGLTTFYGFRLLPFLRGIWDLSKKTLIFYGLPVEKWPETGSL
jgi:hypothetical protein